MKSLNPLGIIKDPAGEETLDPVKSMELLATTHFPGCKDDKPSRKFTRKTRNIEGKLNYITTEKVTEAIKSFGDFKAPGPDGFKPCVLKQLSREAVEHLTKLYTASILLSYTPTCWTKSTVIFIPKPGKDDYTVPKAYRDIAVQRCIWCSTLICCDCLREGSQYNEEGELEYAPICHMCMF